MPARATDQLMLRVAIKQDVNQIQVGGSTTAVLKNADGQVLTELQAGSALNATAADGSVSIGRWQENAVWVEPQDDGFVWIGDKWYRGRTKVVSTSGGITAVNYVELDEYLYSVVGSEMPTSWPLEALKAQAVTARSYALYQRQGSANTVFDVGNTTRWQVYHGIEKEAASTQAAVQETRGQVLTHNGQIINAVFHSSSGGHTANVEDVWVTPLPYLRGVPDYDQDGNNRFRWTETFNSDQMRARITDIGNILSFVPERMTDHGRVITMRVVGDAGEKRLSGDEIRRALGLNSTLFNVQIQGGQIASTDGAVPPNQFVFNGGGYGHGVGMSQYGARGLAVQGSDYRQILSHYYQGTTLARIRVE
ncbi:MAG: SpoIID/LytB domain-containing protein [Kaiparowitsia implicata GSE-PSE-MK54-09C]|nr:SpoIID/LytB domain-containing protein [Kaiparowitsia implicata GSE-PSE-MK54-09C]